MRRLLPEGVVMYTGDDFNYAELIAGDAQGFSHGLLGIFDPIAPAAAAAFARLEAGDRAGFHAILDPTVALSRRLFEAPTQHYKCGVVFLAWLNGFQSHFRMVGGAESARGILHYADLFRLADQAGLFVDPELRGAPHGASLRPQRRRLRQENDAMHAPLLDAEIYDQIRETARRFAEEVVRPVAAELDRDERFPGRDLPRRWASSACSASPCRRSMAAPGSTRSPMRS